MMSDNTTKVSKTTLHEDVVTDIISRLPVKSVFQSRCLSKNFSSITSNPHFIDTHLQQSARLRPSIIVNNKDGFALIRCTASDSKVAVQELTFHPDLDLPNRCTMMTEIVGSCNGLLLLVHVGKYQENCYLWNPSTSQCDNHIPATTTIYGILQPMMLLTKPSWGFGYCSQSREYKIVRIASYYHGTEDYIRSNNQIKFFVEVLTYGKDIAWRRLDFSKFNVLCHGNGLAVDGLVYWKCSEYGDKNRLLTFDLAKEEFRWCLCPVPMTKIRRIMEFKGLLATCAKYEINKGTFCFHLWVLKDKSSWEKIYTSAEFVGNMDPVQCLNDRYILLLNTCTDPDVVVDGTIVFIWPCCLYDMERGEVMEIPGPSISAYHWSGFHKFVESVVALHGWEDDSEFSSDGNDNDGE